MNRELEMVMGLAMIQMDRQCVALVVSKLGSRASDGALMCRSSVDEAFSIWEKLMCQL